ncbi:hypothetical protein CPB84DRAFT_1841120 [Gymnopilus junonius]|uniref:Uncharacterized protein n=1 Tax=Gymnopilus junonius TaxID=109634 RepID=A0A9P5TU88_GYMJU|nr:hypothetical protein CPB84DRAFT_1841120 [Gymnopilus junonius]
MSTREQRQPVDSLPGGILSAEWIKQVKVLIKTSYLQDLGGMQPVDVPVEDRPKYNELLKELHLYCNDVDQKLQKIYAVAKSEDVMCKLIVINCIVQAQWSMLSTGSNPRYIITFETLKNVSGDIQGILNLVLDVFYAFSKEQEQQDLDQQIQEFRRRLDEIRYPQGPYTTSSPTRRLE